jgi:hypothetical protein
VIRLRLARGLARTVIRMESSRTNLVPQRQGLDPLATDENINSQVRKSVKRTDWLERRQDESIPVAFGSAQRSRPREDEPVETRCAGASYMK